MTTSRIGLLGGTFDPVHIGHLQLAEAAVKECGLDRLLFIPSASPPHKLGTPVTSFAHRLAMLELACKGKPRISCSRIEGDLPKPSYTIDTLHTLSAIFHEAEFFFIIGIDAFLDFTTWKAYREILRLVHIVIALRSGFSQTQLTDFLQRIGYFWQNNSWRDEHGEKRIFLLETIPGQFSSTLIRQKIRKRLLPQGDIPTEVLEYIVKHRLYQADAGQDRHDSGPLR